MNELFILSTVLVTSCIGGHHVKFPLSRSPVHYVEPTNMTRNDTVGEPDPFNWITTMEVLLGTPG